MNMHGSVYYILRGDRCRHRQYLDKVVLLQVHQKTKEEMYCTSMLLVLGLCVYQAMAVHETHHMVLHTPDYDVHQDIIANVQENYVYDIVGNVKTCDRCLATVNYHDFDTGMLAFKDIPKDTCYLVKSPVDVLNMTVYRVRHSTIKHYFAGFVHPRILPSPEVEALAGRRIAEFCQDYNVKRVDVRRLRTDGLKTPFENSRLKRAETLMLSCGSCNLALQTLPDYNKLSPALLNRTDFEQVHEIRK